MKRALILVIPLCLLLTGCTSWMSGSHVTVKQHSAEYSSPEPGNVTVSDDMQMAAALADMVERGAEQGVFYVSSLDQTQAEAFMDTAIGSVIHDHPIGAYAVEKIGYDYGTNAGQSALAVDISYRHNRDEILRIRQVYNMIDARESIAEALKGYETSLVMRVENYASLDFEQLVQDYADENPNIVMEVPQTVASVFPESGRDRVVELKFSYQTSRDELRVMQSRVGQLFDSAKLYVDGDSEDREKYSQLYAFLMERNEYQLDTSITPAYSLLQHGVGDSKAFATVYAAMCRQAGLECMVVSGTRAGEPWFWNMVCDEGNYFHVDLLRCSELGRFRETYDSQMEGYVWNYSAYPKSEMPAPPEPTTPETTTPEPTTPEPTTPEPTSAE